VADSSGEIWFYHLERSTLDQVLPELLDKTLQRGWCARVRISRRRANHGPRGSRHGSTAHGAGR
jgi:hypothetical protein